MGRGIHVNYITRRGKKVKAATLSLAVKENTQSVLEKEPLVSLPVFIFQCYELFAV